MAVLQPSGGKWFWRPAPNPSARARVICFPYAGAGASAFRAWHKTLAADIELVAVQLPGRENRYTEKRFDRLTDLIPVLGRVIAELADRPFVFFGHSMGALVAFELTRQLKRSGQPGPQHLVVSGHRAPHLPRPEERMHLLDDDALLARMGDYNGTPAELLANEALMQLFLPLLRDDFAMVETYACTDRTPVGCPLTALGGDADPEVSEDQLKAWAELAGGSFEYQIFAGDHFYLHAHRDEIHARLQASLQQALHQPVDALV